ncbi:MAG: two-component regulator propeller domain-containing protein [Acidobacteriota bacterium]
MTLDADTSPKLHNLSVIQGLSQNSVWCILRDRQGFMWFGTDDGLNKYDGYRFQVFRHKKDDPTTILHNTVRALLQDHTGLIWIGTSGGLNVYDPVTELISAYVADPHNPDSLSSNEISSLAEDSRGTIWIGTRTNGICRFDRERKTFRRYTDIPGPVGVRVKTFVMTLYIDRSGTLWAGCLQGGLFRYDPSTDTFVPGVKEGGLPDYNVYSIFEDSKSRFWIGTRGAGIIQLDRETGRYRQLAKVKSSRHFNLDSASVLTIGEDREGRILYGSFGGGLTYYTPETGERTVWRHSIYDPYSLGGDQVMALYFDQFENLWIGTYTGGVSRYDPHGEHFVTYRNEIPHMTLLTDNNVRSLYRDRDGSIWAGTSKGLTIIDPKTGRTEQYQNAPGDSHSLNDNFVSAIYRDRKGTMWIGTRDGLHIFDRRTKRFTRILENPKDPRALKNGYVRQVLEDRHGVLWIATLDGLHVLDRTTMRFKRYELDRANPKSISNNNIRSLYEDRNGSLWIGTYGGGFDRYDRESDTFQRFMHDPNNPNSVSHDFASPVSGDRDGMIWVGTYGFGLNRYDPKTGTFTNLTESDGLCNNTIYGIQPCADGRIWITTNSGISCYDPKTRRFKNYTSSSGLQGEEFNLNSSFQAEDGTLYFGGPNGFNEFHPARIQENSVVPPVFITGMHIFNKPLKSDSSITLKRHVKLEYDENSLNFDFVALNYRKPELNRYRHKLEGFDKEWSTAGSSRRASYTNLSPGTYVFRVQGSNNDDVWNMEGAAITIVIAPPFWLTWWAYTLYVLSVLGIFAAILWYVQRRQRRILMMEQQRHESELIRQKNIKLKEANDEILRHQEILKERSDQIEWTNQELKEEILERHRAEDQLKEALAEKEVLLKEIHHRVKNNLTIVGSLLGMQSDIVVNDSDRQLFHEAKNRVITMAQIHEKLYQSKNLADIDFGEYIRGVATQLFHAYNNGSAQLRIHAEKVKFGVDTAIPCGLIINELVTNSLKYAFPEGAHGMVLVELRSTPEKEYEIVVGDTGIGFPDSVDFRSTETMGLTLVRSLVKQLRGTIELDINYGTKFTIRFPLEKN